MFINEYGFYVALLSTVADGDHTLSSFEFLDRVIKNDGNLSFKFCEIN